MAKRSKNTGPVTKDNLRKKSGNATSGGSIFGKSRKNFAGKIRNVKSS